MTAAPHSFQTTRWTHVVRLQAGADDTERDRILTQLCRAYWFPLYSYARRSGRSPHDAEDLTQEVFVEVWRSLDGFRGESRLSTWIYRLAVNKSLEMLRSRKRKKRLGFFRALAGLDDASAQQAVDKWNHPGIALEQKDRARVLFSAMARLPDSQRSALVLQKIEGLNQTEIAGILDVSVASVESLLHRAKKNLHTLLLKHYQSDSL